MAQRLVHYLLGEMLADAAPQLCGEALSRFRVGNLLPDAYGPGKPSRELRHRTHFIAAAGEGERFSDFERFRLLFPGRLPGDGLYLGYYLHLVEDACFRVFWHSLPLEGGIRSQEDVSFLHRDYHILNRRLVTARGLEYRPLPDICLQNEPITAIHPFDLPLLRADIAADFADDAEGEMRFLSAELIEAFIARAFPVCEDALSRLLSGKEPLDPLSLAWKGGGVS